MPAGTQGSVIPMMVDIVGGLNQVGANNNYANDAELQQAVADVFIPLHDAHTRYNKPSPYRYSTFTLPFTLYQMMDGNTQSLYILYNNAWIQDYNSLYGPSTFSTNINGWKISTIDGEDAVSHVSEYAIDKIGYTKDAGSRFNLAVNGYGNGLGYFTYRSQQAFGAPSGPIVFGVVNPVDKSVTNVTVNWLGLYSPPASLSATYRNRGLVSGHLASKAQRFVTELDFIREIGNAQLRDAQERQGHAHVGDSTYTDVTFTTLPDGTGVLKLANFYPADGNETTWINVVQDSITNHKAAGGDKLIIDLRNNGGGDICLGYATIRYLYPSLTPTELQDDATPNPYAAPPPPLPFYGGRYDMAASDLFQDLSETAAEQMCDLPSSVGECSEDPEEAGYFTPCAWRNANPDKKGHRRTFYDDTWMMNGTSIVRGNTPSRVSRLIQEACDYQFNYWNTPGCLTDYPHGNVVLLSDGLCGSTCSVFSSFLQLNSLAKTVTIGGIAGQPQMFWSFPGGEVETIDYIISVLNTMACRTTLLSLLLFLLMLHSALPSAKSIHGTPSITLTLPPLCQWNT